MSIVQSALRTVKRSEISAEFYSFPQRYVLGTDPDAEALEKWKAAMSGAAQLQGRDCGTSSDLLWRFLLPEWWILRSA